MTVKELLNKLENLPWDVRVETFTENPDNYANIIDVHHIKPEEGEDFEDYITIGGHWYEDNN